MIEAILEIILRLIEIALAVLELKVLLRKEDKENPVDPCKKIRG